MSTDTERVNAEIAAHPRAALIGALADAMQSIEDDDGNGRHISYYRSLAYATVEILPGLSYDEDARRWEEWASEHDFPTGTDRFETQQDRRLAERRVNVWSRRGVPSRLVRQEVTEHRGPWIPVPTAAEATT